MIDDLAGGASLDIGQALLALERMLTRPMAPVLASIGAAEVVDVRARITSVKESPEGEPWAPWSPRRRREREAKGNTDQGLLWDTGRLLNSMQYQSTGPDGIDIGTDVPYALELQEGRAWPSPMPARPFLGWNDQSLEAIAHTLAAYYLDGKL